ncbi:IniB N-terminal domain-containing protein [Umezawaea sp. Da 62-37]|uniref:IniB N-terminal domain-containing protein n=1 Tax=Umezawaea sp. Da 62-37 TaxID=3075927 RepID=UPI0028F6E89E|nr:IniB N-terminal domain-containing protein [Umezawaea sp. Da 62-37]WNV82119.1 IniB N-terminal domain-containing protein [Umezawaea sp. Da 62-37]
MSSHTLHEFVLGLLSDPTALADFQNDAEGALGAAGLGDISAVDVQEVLPLVLDYVPAGSLPALDGSVLNGMPVDLDLAGPAGAITQLQVVTQLVGVPSTTDVNLAATGAIAADETGLEAFTGLSAWGLADAAGAADIKIPGDFSAVNDVTGSLDATLDTTTGQVDDLADSATGALHGVTATASGVTGTLPGTEGLTSHVFGSVDTLHGVVDGVTGGLTDGLDLGRTLDVGSLDNIGLSTSAPLGADTLGTVGGDVLSHSAVGGVVSNVTDSLDHAHLPGSDLLGVTDLLF